MSRVFIISVIISLILHIIFIFVLSSNNRSGVQANESNNGISKINILPMEKLPPTHPSFLKSDLYYGNKPHGGSYTNEQICSGKDKNYIGVGMIIQPGTNRVTNVPEQYPAYKAGIRNGDIIVDPYGPTIMNGYVSFDIRRGDQILNIKIHAEKICYSG